MPSADSRRLAIDAWSRGADRIVNLILHTSLPRVDIEIRIENFRRRVVDSRPDREALFEMVYGSRFRRIWDQWSSQRPEPDEPWAPSAWA